MNYIRINLNKKYIDTRGRRYHSLLLTRVIILLSIGGCLINWGLHIKNSALRKEVYIQRELRGTDIEKLSLLKGKIAKLNRDIAAGRKTSRKYNHIYRLIDTLPDHPVSRVIHTLEKPAAKLKVQLSEFSIRGDEIFLYIQDPKIDLVEFIGEFERHFGKIIITEHSADRLTLRIGDIYD